MLNEEQQALVNIGRAKQALAAARSLTDVLNIRDVAVAAVAWATARGADEAAQMATEIKLRSERKAGQFLASMKEQGRIVAHRPKEVGHDVPVKLSDIDIKPQESQRWQRIAGIPDERFEEYLLNAKKRTQASLLITAAKYVQETEPVETPPFPQRDAQVFQGGFKEVSMTKLQENSIDYIITDLPYGEQFLDLYGKLGEVASRLLKPGGSLLVMTGQSYLPDVFDLLRPHLTYNWTVAYLTPGGQSAQLWERKVNTFWKPVLWFVKGKYEGKWVGDVAKSAPNDNEKQLMEWQQSESGIADLVERFTKPNDLILDPCMGSATTGIVATRLGRRFIGIDIDPKKVEIAKRRMGISN